VHILIAYSNVKGPHEKSITSNTEGIYAIGEQNRVLKIMATMWIDLNALNALCKLCVGLISGCYGSKSKVTICRPLSILQYVLISLCPHPFGQLLMLHNRWLRESFSEVEIGIIFDTFSTYKKAHGFQNSANSYENL
jgi:hypothetical protein